MAYQDGNFSNAIQDGPARIFYPFINAATKDNVTKGTVRNYVVVPSSYTPAAALSTDPADNTQYLLNESELTVEGGLGRFSRTYCKVPTDQVDYSSIVINKPAFPTNFYANAYVDSTSANVTANIFSSAILADNCQRYPSGGTYTVLYFTYGNTNSNSISSAINYNANSATIASVLNALPKVIADNIVVSVTGSADSGEITVTKISGTGQVFGNFTPNVANLTPDIVPSPSTYAGSDSAFMFFPRKAVTVGKAAHGLNNNATIRWAGSPNVAGTTAIISNVTSDTFTIQNPYTTQPNLGAPNVVYYRKIVRTYTPGTDRVLTKQTDKFYLPSVTAGITTAADIPVPDVAINDTQLLDLIAGSATGFQNYDAEPVTGWPSDQSPVYRQRFIQINVDDL